jgi:hypothetical protein
MCAIVVWRTTTLDAKIAAISTTMTLTGRGTIPQTKQFAQVVPRVISTVTVAGTLSITMNTVRMATV